MMFFQPAEPVFTGPPLRVLVKKWEPAITVLEVIGEVDTVTAPLLDERIAGQWDPQRFLLADLSEVTFLCSAGLSVLLAASEQAQTDDVDLRLIATPRPVQRLLALTGLEAALPIYPTLLAALPLQR